MDEYPTSVTELYSNEGVEKRLVDTISQQIKISQ
jgi:hypothetical protein